MRGSLGAFRTSNFFQWILLLRQKIEVAMNVAHSIQSKRHPRPRFLSIRNKAQTRSRNRMIREN